MVNCLSSMVNDRVNEERCAVKHVGDVMGPVQRPEAKKAQTAQTGGRNMRYVARSAPEICPICKGRGFLVYDVPPGDPNFNRTVPCRCTEARLAAEHARELRSVSNLGALERMTFDDFLPDGVGLPEAVRRALRNAYELSLNYAREPNGWLVLLGGYGSGKTHLAAAIANYRISLGHSALFVVVPDLLDHLRSTYSPTSDTGLDERMEMIRETPLLILDDLGAHNSTPWAQEKLFQIINYRYNARLATVITTNLRLEDIDPRISSRLADIDIGQLIEIQAPDYRGSGQSGISHPNRGEINLSSLEHHVDQTFENFSLRLRDDMLAEQRESLREALAEARTYAAEPKGWLVFFGPYGSGKTHLAAAIANYQLANSRPTPMFIVVPDLLDHLRATFAPTSTISLDRAFEQIKTVSLLVLDDLGTENATPWAKEKLFQLFNYRYVAKLPTVITTNQTLQKMDKNDTRVVVDPHLASRMSDVSRSTTVFMKAPTYRGGEEQQAAKRGRLKAKS
jgi:DNA replication protein DnaC